MSKISKKIVVITSIFLILLSIVFEIQVNAVDVVDFGKRSYDTVVAYSNETIKNLDITENTDRMAYGNTLCVHEPAEISGQDYTKVVAYVDINKDGVGYSHATATPVKGSKAGVATQMDTSSATYYAQLAYLAFVGDMAGKVGFPSEESGRMSGSAQYQNAVRYLLETKGVRGKIQSAAGVSLANDSQSGSTQGYGGVSVYDESETYASNGGFTKSLANTINSRYNLTGTANEVSEGMTLSARIFFTGANSTQAFCILFGKPTDPSVNISVNKKYVTGSNHYAERGQVVEFCITVENESSQDVNMLLTDYYNPDYYEFISIKGSDITTAITEVSSSNDSKETINKRITVERWRIK